METPWRAARNNAGVYEILGFRHPATEHAVDLVAVARSASREEARSIAAALNSLWATMARCQILTQEFRTSEAEDVTQKRFDQILALLDSAIREAATIRPLVSDSNSTMLTQTFNLLHRAMRECSALVLRHKSQRDLHLKFVAMQQLYEASRAAQMQVQELYLRRPR